MAESFSVGEVAIFAGCPRAFHAKRTSRSGDLPIGSEVTVISRLHPRTCTNVEGRPVMDVYVVKTQDDRELGVPPAWLRKRRPPQDWAKLCNLTDSPRKVPEHV